MPERPEVEVLVRHLGPLLVNRTVRTVHVRRSRVLAPTTVERFKRALHGATCEALVRRGEYLLFTLRSAKRNKPLLLVGHLGMTGRVYLLPARIPWPKHAAVVLDLGRDSFVFEDTRYFGRFTLDTSAVEGLGPERRLHVLATAFAPATNTSAVVLDLGRDSFVFEDTRYFGRFT